MAGLKQVELLNKRLKDIVEQFETWRKMGIDEEIMIIYLHDKTKLSKTKVKELLDAQEVFHRKLISRLAAEDL